MKKFVYRNRGLTLIELLIASTISAVVLTSLFVSLGNVYFSQKKVTAVQSFASESRFLMERVAQLVRNNTIDYDRFFIEVGPGNTGEQCPFFNIEQVREGTSTIINESTPVACNCDILSGCSNTDDCRAAVGYERLFYWNVVPDEEIPRYRNLGGKKPSSISGVEDQVDNCVRAWSGPLDTLYLINEARTERVALKAEDGRLQMERQFGVDTSPHDGFADTWSSFSKWKQNGSDWECEVLDAEGTSLGQAMDAFTEKDCARAHSWVSLSPRQLEILDFEFIPGPDREPFLSYRIEEVQIQPHVFLRLKTKLKEPELFGLDPNSDKSVFTLTQQTTASSRVFGDIR